MFKGKHVREGLLSKPPLPPSPPHTLFRTLKIGVEFLGGEISDQNINPIFRQPSARGSQYSSGQMVHLGMRGLWFHSWDWHSALSRR